jgi:hypothetical protein
MLRIKRGERELFVLPSGSSVNIDALEQWILRETGLSRLAVVVLQVEYEVSLASVAAKCLGVYVFIPGTETYKIEGLRSLDLKKRLMALWEREGVRVAGVWRLLPRVWEIRVCLSSELDDLLRSLQMIAALG